MLDNQERYHAVTDSAGNSDNNPGDYFGRIRCPQCLGDQGPDDTRHYYIDGRGDPGAEE